MHARETRPHYHFKPLDVGRWLLWGLFAAVLALAPLPAEAVDELSLELICEPVPLGEDAP